MNNCSEHEFKSFNHIRQDMNDADWERPKSYLKKRNSNEIINKKVNYENKTNGFNLLYESDDEEDNLQQIDNNILMFNKKRTNAFQIFQNKKMISNILYRTKMCNRFNCDRVNCNFAHKPEELRNPKCIFDESCQFIHSKTNPCPFLHSCETVSEFKIRTGLNRPGKVFINIKEIKLDD